MNKQTVDRITEALAVLCVAAALVVLGGWARDPDVGRTLAGLKVQEIEDQDLERFRDLIREVRRKVDSNIDPGSFMARLKTDYPGRHEVWVLSARFNERAGHSAAAMADYARAVRLNSDYIDKGSGFFLGRRIESLADLVLSDLVEKKRRGDLDETGKRRLETAYFLKRRLAGGCE